MIEKWEFDELEGWVEKYDIFLLKCGDVFLAQTEFTAYGSTGKEAIAKLALICWGCSVADLVVKSSMVKVVKFDEI